MLDREAEEAGEAQRLDPRRDGFEGAAEHLRAHVDAEHGLRGGARPRAGLPREAARDTAAEADLDRLEHGDVARQVGRRGRRRGEARGPGVAEGGLTRVERVQRRVPGQAHGQEVEHAVVGLAHQLRRPTQSAHQPGPARDGEQRAVEVIVGVALGDPDGGERGGAGGDRVLGQPREGGAETG